jgi:hypothetical protein
MVNVILRGSLNNAQPSRESSLRGLEALSGECNALLAFCGTVRRGLTTASARAAAVVQAYLTGDQTYPFMGYRNVVTQNFAELTPIATSVFARAHQRHDAGPLRYFRARANRLRSGASG